MMQVVRGLVRGLALYNLALLLGVMLIVLISVVAPRFGVDFAAAQYAVPGVAFALLGVLLAIYLKRRQQKRTPETGPYKLTGSPAGTPTAEFKVWRVLLLPAAIVLAVLLVDFGPRAWNWLTSSEDLGARLRRECETVVRESHPETATNASLREWYVRRCIDARAKIVR